MMIPPMMRIGAETMIVRPMNTTVWTCWTSLVLRVISDAGPNLLISTCENVSTLGKIARAHVAPEAHRDPGPPVDRDDRGDPEQRGHHQHQPADADDVLGVALGDAVVDDLAVEVGR